jgi:hypothetical protein
MIGTLAPERLSVLHRVASIESTGSSTRIEGSRLSDRDYPIATFLAICRGLGERQRWRRSQLLNPFLHR